MTCATAPGLTQRQRDKVLAKAAAVREVMAGTAIEVAAARHRMSAATLRRALKAIDGVEPGRWLDALSPDYSRCGRKARNVDPTVWRVFRVDYMRLEQPSAASCHQRLAVWCAKNDRDLPPLHRLTRMLAKIPRPRMVAARGGREALDRLYPAQERTVDGLALLERVNGDGWPVDVFVETPSGRVVRPVLWVWQDVLSRKALAWRVAETESADLVLSTFRDLCRTHGVPGHVHVDNTRAVSAFGLTAGSKGRKRFGDAPRFAGAFAALGVKVHFTQLVATDGRTRSGRLRSKGRGQGKPVERMFRSLADELARHPGCAGFYAGSSPATKPANHNSGAAGLPWHRFAAMADSVIARHNARKGRRTEKGGGELSADDVFEDAVSRHRVRQASDIELDVLLRPAETVKVAHDGSVRLRAGAAPGLGANRYWAEGLYGHVGKRLLARYDPTNLHGDIRLFDHSGRFVCSAGCLMPGGFGDAADAASHNRARREFVRLHRRAEMARARADRHLADEVASSETGGQDAAPCQAEVAGLPKRRRKRPETATDAADRINKGWRIIQGGQP